MRSSIFMFIMTVAFGLAPAGLPAHRGMEHGRMEQGGAGVPAKTNSIDDVIAKAKADHDAAFPKAPAAQDHSEHKPDDKDEAKADIVEITGEFIDLSCNTIHQSEGPDHADCAEKCAAAGMPVALRDSKDGKLYVLITEEHFVNAAGPALGKMGKKVKVSAKVLKNGNLDLIVPVKVELVDAKAAKAAPKR